MAEIGFYHLTRSALEQALPRLLEKARESGKRALVKTGSDARTEALSELLWTYDPAGFLAHGTKKDGFPEEQPIWLTADDGNANGAEILLLTDGAVADDLAGFARCLELFDGRDEAAVAAARTRWRDYKRDGHLLTYWRQTDAGKWVREDQGGG